MIPPASNNVLSVSNHTDLISASVIKVECDRVIKELSVWVVVHNLITEELGLVS